MKRFIIGIVLLAAMVSMAPAQELLGRVLGRVVPLDGKADPKTTAVRVEVTIDGDRRTLAEGSITADGYFSFPVPRTAADRWLVVAAGGWAPLRVPLAATPNGEGLWLGDLRPARGAALTVTAPGADVLGPDAVAQLYPEPGADRVIDIDAPPLTEAPFSGGVAVLEHVAPGDWVIVITDGGRTFTPIVRPWKMGILANWIMTGPVSAGQDADIEVIAAGEETLDGYCDIPTGEHHPLGGASYVLRHRPVFDQSTHGRFVWKARHLAPTIATLHMRAGTRAGRFEFFPNGRSQKVELPRGQKVQGQVRESGGGPIARAHVHLGSRKADTDADGRFEFLGVEAGAFDVVALAERFAAPEKRRLIVFSDEDPAPLDFFVEAPSVLVGVVEDKKKKPVADVMVGFISDAVADARFGEPVLDITSKTGEFKMTRLSRGNGIAYAVATRGGSGVPNPLTIASGTENRATLDLAVGGTVEGKVAYVTRRPAANAVVSLVSRSLAVEELFRRPAIDRRRPWIERTTLTAADGSYGFTDVLPGSYHLMIDAPGRPPFYAGAIDVAEGLNRNGFDWVVGKVESRKIVLPAGCAVRLRRWNSVVDETWLGASTKNTEFDLSEEFPGFMRFERIEDPTARPDPSRAVPSFGGKTLDDGTGDFLLNEGEIQPPIEKKIYGIVRGSVTINGGGVDVTGAELIAYPVDTSPDVRPVLLFVNLKTGTFEATLARGTYLLVARAPGFADGVIGPVAVAVGMESETLDGLAIDCPAAANVTGRVTLARDADPAAAAEMTVSHVPSWHAMISRWNPPSPAVRVRAGNYFLDGVAIGSGRMVAASERLRGAVDVETGSGLQARAADLVLGARPAMPTFAPRGFEAVERATIDDWSVSGARMPFVDLTRDGRHAPNYEGVEPRLYAKRMLIEYTDRPIVETRAVLAGPRSDEAVERAFDPGPLRWRGGIVIDGRRPGEALHLLVPAMRNEFAFGVPFLALETKDNGTAEFSGLWGGEYESIVRWFGDDGRLYRKHSRIRVGQGDETNGRGAVEFKTAPVKFRVLLANQEPAAGAIITLTPSEYRGKTHFGLLAAERANVVEGVIERDGEVEFTSVPGGTYDVEVASDVAGVLVATGIEIVPGRPERTYPMTMPVRSTLLVTLKAESKAAVVGARIHILDVNGAVVLPGRRFLTGTDGKCRVQMLGPGRYTVHATTADGTAFFVGSLELSAGATGNLEATAPRTGLIVCSVKDEAGHPLPGARIEIMEKGAGGLFCGAGNSAQELWPTTTDGFGYFASRPLAAGAYDILIEVDGFRQESRSIVLGAGAAEPVDVALQKSEEKH